MTFINTRHQRAFTIAGPQDLFRQLMKWIENRAKRNEISRLLEQEDFVLKDIGVTRGDVREALASTGDPSLNLRILAAKRRFWTRSRDQI